MRNILALTFAALAMPAAAWEFAPTPICTLTHANDAAMFTITYDDSLPEYTLSVTLRAGTWPDAPAFQMGFIGTRGGQIGTSLHMLSEDATTLIVRDRGFGNVLDGLAFNDTGYAATQGRSVAFDMAGIAAPLRAFRACPAALPATS